MGSVFGGQTQPATYSYGGNPAAYIPTGQPSADQYYQSLLGFGTGAGGGLGVPAGQFPTINPANYGYGQATGIFNQANPLVSEYFINPGTAQFAGDTASQGANTYLSQVAPYYSGVPGTLAGAAGTALGLESTLLGNAQNPLYASLVGGAAGNPFFGQTLAGAQQGAGIGGTAAGQAGAGSSYLNALAPQIAGLGALYGSQIGALAPAVSGYGNAAAGMAQQAAAPAPWLQGLAGQLQGGIAGAAAPLQGLSQQLISTGFDPQQALYNRTTQQVMNQAMAAQAAAGVGNTPYGAGVTGNTLSNFNIDWQNQQLARQVQAAQAADQTQQTIGNLLALSGQTAGGLTNAAANTLGTGLSGLGTAGGLQGQAAGILGQAYNAPLTGAQAAGGLLGQGFNLGQGGAGLAASAGGLPSAAYMQNLSSVLPFLRAQSQAGVAGAGGLDTLLGGAGGAYGTGLGVGNQLLAGTGQAAALPYSTNAMIGQNALSALGSLAGLNTGAANLGMSAYGLPQQVINDLNSYLGLGQAAQTNALSGGQQGFGQTAAGFGGLIGGANQLFNPNYGLFGSGGLSSVAPYAYGSLGLSPLGTDAATTLGGGAPSFLSSVGSFLTNPFGLFG